MLQLNKFCIASRSDQYAVVFLKRGAIVGHVDAHARHALKFAEKTFAHSRKTEIRKSFPLHGLFYKAHV
jgi:hypothetical protein